MALYEYIGSGAVVTGGYATSSNPTGHIYTGSGSLASGSGTLHSRTIVATLAVAGPNTGGHALTSKASAYPYIGSGGLGIDGGESLIAITKAYSAETNDILTGGVATTEVIPHRFFYTAETGDIVVDGTADPIIRTHAYEPPGGYFVGDPPGGEVFGGSASKTKTKAYEAVTNDIITGGIADTEIRHTSGDYTASGGLTTGGSADPVLTTKAYVPSGGLTTSGSAPLEVCKIYLPAGGLATGGSASTSTDRLFTYTPSGGITSGGSATSIQIVNVVATGGLIAGGSATRAIRKVYYGSGGATFSGGVIVHNTFVFASSGAIGITTYGVAETHYVPQITGSGGGTFGGVCLSATGRNFPITLELFSRPYPPRLLTIPGRPDVGTIHIPGRQKTYLRGDGELFHSFLTLYPFLSVKALTRPPVRTYEASGGMVSGGSAYAY
jgi:hypothetical protein